MADNIEVGFKMVGLDVITKNTEQLNNQLNKAKQIAEKVGFDSKNIQVVKAIANEMSKVGDVSKMTVKEINELSKAIKEASEELKRFNDNSEDTGKKAEKSISGLKGTLKALGSQATETAADSIQSGDDLAQGITALGGVIVTIGLQASAAFGPIGLAIAAAALVLTPFISSMFELSDAEKQAAEDLEAFNKRLEEFSNLLVDALDNYTDLAEGLQEGFDLSNLNRQKEFLKEFVTLTIKLANAQASGNQGNIDFAEQEIANYEKRRDAAIEEERNTRLQLKLNEDKIKAEQERLKAFTVSNEKQKELDEEKDKEQKAREKEAEDRNKKAIADRKQRESKALQERLDGINKINDELDKEIKKLNDLANNGSFNQQAEQQAKVLAIQEKQIKAIDDAEKATRSYIEVSKALKDLREQDAANDQKRSLIEQEEKLKAAIDARSKAEIDALLKLIKEAEGSDDINGLLGDIFGDNAEAGAFLEDIINRFGETGQAIDELRKAGVKFDSDFNILNQATVLPELEKNLKAVQLKLSEFPDKAKEANEKANKTVEERFIQGAKDANAAYFETLGKVDPELTKAGVKSFQQSLNFLYDEKNLAVAKLINEKKGILEKFNTLFDTEALSLDTVNEKLVIDESKLIEARAKLTGKAEQEAFDNQQSAFRKVIELANAGKEALEINHQIALNKLQITYNDEYIAAYKKRFDDVTRLSQLEYDEALFAQEQFTNAELDQFKKAATERKKLGKKQTQEEKDNILFAKQEALTLLERQFDEENELLQNQQLDPLNALRAKLEDAKLTPEQKEAIQKQIELQQREAELAIAKAQSNQAKKRESVGASFDSLIEDEEKKKKTQETIKEITDIAKASQQLIGELFDYAIQADQARLDLLNEQLTGLDEQISNTQGKISELEDDLEGKRSGRRDAVLQSIELEKQREIDLANQKILLEKKIAEEQRKIRIKEQAAAIAQAIINGALSITAITTVPDFTLGIASAIRIGLVAASTAAQVATIASQKFAKGGILDGNSHANGGIQTPYGELEGGEAVINKNSTRLFAPLLSQINEAGGGRRFATGGILDTKSLSDNSNSASSKDVVGIASMNQMNQQLIALLNKPIFVRPTEVTNMAASTARMVSAVMI
jgi:hypothetical protein